MAAIVTTINFSDGDQVTSGKLNEIATGSTFSAAGLDNTTLKVTAGKLSVGTITSSEMGTASVLAAALGTGSVIEAKIGTGAVTTDKIGDLAVTTAKIAASGITTAKIADANITPAKLNGAQTGSAPIYGVRAWVTFDMTRNAAGGSDTAATNRFIIASGNVASVLKQANNLFRVTFTTAMGSSNYAYSACGARVAGGTVPFIGRPVSGTKTTAVIDMEINDSSSLDPTEISMMFIE